MIKTIFVGRKNFKRDYAEFLARMASEAKDGRSLLSFRKKKDDEESYPRIFLISGGVGSGKSALSAQWADLSRSIGLEIKKPMKVVTLDAEEILSKNMLMLRTLIEALYGAFIDGEMEAADILPNTRTSSAESDMSMKKWNNYANGNGSPMPLGFRPPPAPTHRAPMIGRKTAAKRTTRARKWSRTPHSCIG